MQTHDFIINDSDDMKRSEPGVHISSDMIDDKDFPPPLIQVHEFGGQRQAIGVI